MAPTLSIIVPAFNEEGNIQAALVGLDAARYQADVNAEIIVVNDGSDDRTGSNAELVAMQLGGIRVLHHATNRGLRVAYETGLNAATGRYVTWVPGDGEMAWSSLVDIFRAIGSADLVVPYHGTPERRAWFRRLLTWGSTVQLNWLLGHGLHYFQGTVVYPTDLARALPRTEAGFFFNAEMLCHALDRGLSYVEVPLVHQERQHGVSKAVSTRAIWRAQTLIVRLWYRLRVQTAFQALGWALEHR